MAVAVVINGRNNTRDRRNVWHAPNLCRYACISEESDRIVMRLSTNEIGILATEYSRCRGEENLARSLANG